MGKVLGILVVLLLIAAGGYYLYTSRNQPIITQVPQAEKLKESAQNALENVKEFEIEGKPFSFTPNEIKVKKGETVKIVFKNVEGMHDLVIDEFNVRTKQISAGQSDTIRFKADKAGVYEFYCSVGNHRAMGMVGTLTIEE